MSADDLRQEIEQTRQHLGDTVDELAARADLKAQAKAKAAEFTRRISRSEAMAYRWPFAMIAAGIAIAASALVRRRKQV